MASEPPVGAHDFAPGDPVRVRESVVGFKEGPSEQHGSGAPGEIPAGALCEVWDVDATTGWITVHYDLEESRAREPYRIAAVVDRSMLEPASRREPPDVNQWFQPPA